MSILKEILFGDGPEESPLVSIQCLILISRNDGAAPEEIADKSGLPLSTVAKIIAGLGQYQSKEGVLQLVSVHLYPDRRKRIFITPAGRDFIQSIRLVPSLH